MRTIGNETKAQIIALAKLGYKPISIRRKLNNVVSYSTVYRVCKNRINIEGENRDSISFNKLIEKVKKDEVAQLNEKIQMAFESLTKEKFDEGRVRDLVISLATLIDKKRLLQGESTEIQEIREKLAGMSDAELIQIIRQRPRKGEQKDISREETG